MRFINETATPGKSILREFAGLSSEFDPFVGASVECALLGVWRSPVARVLWEHDVGGSNPLTPTIQGLSTGPHGARSSSG